MAQCSSSRGELGNGKLGIGEGSELALEGDRVGSQKVWVGGTGVLVAEVDRVQNVARVGGSVAEIGVTLGKLGIPFGEE